MDTVSEWALKIARETVPAEVHQSTFIAEDFVKGGRHRKALFKKASGGEIGGLGGEVAYVFPFILQAISVAAPLLYTVLSSEAIPNSIAVVDEIIKIRDALKQKHALQSSQQQESSKSTATSTIQTCIDRMSPEIQTAGVSKEESQDKSCEVIIVLAKDPKSAASFIKELTKKK